MGGVRPTAGGDKGHIGKNLNAASSPTMSAVSILGSSYTSFKSDNF